MPIICQCPADAIVSAGVTASHDRGQFPIRGLQRKLDWFSCSLDSAESKSAHILSRLNEGGGNVIDALRDSEVEDIILVLVAKHRQIDMHARQVHVLPLPNLRVVHHNAIDGGRGIVGVALLHLKHHAPIGHQNLVPRLDRRRKRLIPRAFRSSILMRTLF